MARSLCPPGPPSSEWDEGREPVRCLLLSINPGNPIHAYVFHKERTLGHCIHPNTANVCIRPRANGLGERAAFALCDTSHLTLPLLTVLPSSLSDILSIDTIA